MTWTRSHRLREAIRQLTDIHAVFIEQFNRAVHLLYAELEARGADHWDDYPNQQVDDAVPVLDRSEWVLIYRGRKCYLGNTISFRLLERLLRRPNRDVSHIQLLADVWQGKVSSDALRGAVKNLRTRLRKAGMADVASAIVGRTARHYAFDLSRLN